MKLYHVTPARNVPGIRRRGLLTAKATGRLPAVWLVTPGAVGWAKEHVRAKHRAGRVAVLSLDVPRSKLRRKWRGVWYSLSDLPAPGRVAA